MSGAPGSLRDTRLPGFPSSGLATPVPNLFFSDFLPQIERPEELLVTLYFFFAQTRRRDRRPRFLTARELAADATLARALANLAAHPGVGFQPDATVGAQGLAPLRHAPDDDAPYGQIFKSVRSDPDFAQSPASPAHDALAEGLRLARDRGSLITATLAINGRPEAIYAVNTPANRRLLEALAGEPLDLERPLPPATGETTPNIFALYEENVGPITPLIADHLADAEELYPPEWVREAFLRAVENNKRHWRYISSILSRWEREGPDYEKPERDTEGEWLARRYRQGKRRPRPAGDRPRA